MLLPLLLIGGGVALVLLVTCAGVGIYFITKGGGGGGGGVLGGRNANVTEADLAKVEAYATQAEVEAILGKGEKITPAEWGVIPRNDVETWYGWRNGEDCLLVAFTQGKSGAWRATTSIFVRRTVVAGGARFDPKFGLMGGGGDVDARAAERAGRKQLLESPKWLKGDAAHKGIVGGWVGQELGFHYDFEADGTCREEHGFEKAAGTYRFLDDETVELTLKRKAPFKPVTKKFELRVGKDEMLLIRPDLRDHPETYKRVK